MDVLFENKYTRDKQWAKNFYGYIFFRRPLMMFLYISYATGLVANIIMMIISGEFELHSGAVIMLFCFFIIIVRYCQCVNLEMKRCMEMYGKPVDVVICVTEDKITTKTSTGSEVDMLFENVKKVINTKNYIYLQTQTKLLLCLKKDSFTLGSSDAFKEFLKSKGFRVK